MIDSFRDKYTFLSNFVIVPRGIIYDFRYPTVEHAYQAAKSDDVNDRLALTRIKKASDAKAYGDTIQLRSDWYEIRNEVMYFLLQQKFSNTGLRKLLLATGNEELVEGNYWCDIYWGKCTCKKNNHNNEGENWLGRLLMQLRKELRINADI